jgi:hypothetical protein
LKGSSTMGAVVKLRFGNIFDGPSDLVVLPCSIYGTITPFVAYALITLLSGETGCVYAAKGMS